MKNIDTIIDELKAMVEERTGQPFPQFLMPAVRLTANNIMVIGHVQEELMQSALVSIENGCMGQQKVTVSPLLPYYDKLMRTATLQLEKIGLTYSATPSKITQSTKKGGDGTDPMEAFFAAAR